MSLCDYANGKAITFSIADQIQGAGNDVGSAGWAINARGVIAGRWHDKNFAVHGFVYIPEHHGWTSSDSPAEQGTGEPVESFSGTQGVL